LNRVDRERHGFEPVDVEALDQVDDRRDVVARAGQYQQVAGAVGLHRDAFGQDGVDRLAQAGGRDVFERYDLDADAAGRGPGPLPGDAGRGRMARELVDRHDAIDAGGFHQAETVRTQDALQR